MAKNVIKYIDQTLATWTPRKSFELIKIEKQPVKNKNPNKINTLFIHMFLH